MNVYPELHNFNDMYTPPEALDYIVPFLDKTKTYWEACYGEGHMARELTKREFKVIGRKGLDFLAICGIYEHWDVIITNPPFNGNKKFIKRAIEFGNFNT